MSVNILNASQPVVTTDRFALRPLRKSDMGLIEHYMSEQRMAAMTSTVPHPYPPGAAQAFVERVSAAERDEDAWAMDGTADGGPEVMGVISLKRMDRNQSEISYWVAPPFWNTGLASDAVRALVNANPLGNRTIFATVFQDNPASARVLTHCGFEYIGDAESFSVARGANVPTWTYIKRMD
ncbi:GNAT family N-acetyltransferase [Marivita sp. GX14005]|uniref:GNAT family N-acetyltransferase n=1 Tax=Marivita sp. GX14005 TaxID=2942276 RepID=UPI002018EE5E|nr:GNAT family N-acetyltransferase [Marivita sp. GX14005]MCL3882573.1 GNAT family N-acetyltransferase [Marivita sp. GX14005]